MFFKNSFKKGKITPNFIKLFPSRLKPTSGHLYPKLFHCKSRLTISLMRKHEVFCKVGDERSPEKGSPEVF